MSLLFYSSSLFQVRVQLAEMRVEMEDLLETQLLAHQQLVEVRGREEARTHAFALRSAVVRDEGECWRHHGSLCPLRGDNLPTTRLSPLNVTLRPPPLTGTPGIAG
jgi:hypothetical protein